MVLATDRPAVAAQINARLKRRIDGARGKSACPNFGHLLVALLIAYAANSVELPKVIIREAVVRNMAWMLDGRRAVMAELSYMEPSAVSEHRVSKIQQASKPSCNLLMFANLMRKTATAQKLTTKGSRAPIILRQHKQDL